MKERLLEIVREAGRIILSSGVCGVVQKEGHANYVTAIDQKVEDYLNGALLALLPGSVLIGEEQENEPLGDGLTWVIDPIDGTTNFIRDYRMSAVSVALLENRKPIVGVVYLPYADEMFFAEKGKGAQLNGQAIRAADTPFDRALVAFGTSPYDAHLAKKSLEVALGYLTHAADLRRCGAAAMDLAYIACGRHDVFFELNLRPWDYAAGALLVTEAGGVFDMPFCGEPDFSKTSGIFAAGAACAGEARALFDSFFEEA